MVSFPNLSFPSITGQSKEHPVQSKIIKALSTWPESRVLSCNYSHPQGCRLTMKLLANFDAPIQKMLDPGVTFTSLKVLMDIDPKTRKAVRNVYSTRARARIQVQSCIGSTQAAPLASALLEHSHSLHACSSCFPKRAPRTSHALIDLTQKVVHAFHRVHSPTAPLKAFKSQAAAMLFTTAHIKGKWL